MPSNKPRLTKKSSACRTPPLTLHDWVKSNTSVRKDDAPAEASGTSTAYQAAAGQTPLSKLIPHRPVTGEGNASEGGAGKSGAAPVQLLHPLLLRTPPEPEVRRVLPPGSSGATNLYVACSKCLEAPSGSGGGGADGEADLNECMPVPSLLPGAGSIPDYAAFVKPLQALPPGFHLRPSVTPDAAENNTVSKTYRWWPGMYELKMGRTAPPIFGRLVAISAPVHLTGDALRHHRSTVFLEIAQLSVSIAFTVDALVNLAWSEALVEGMSDREHDAALLTQLNHFVYCRPAFVSVESPGDAHHAIADVRDDHTVVHEAAEVQGVSHKEAVAPVDGTNEAQAQAEKAQAIRMLQSLVLPNKVSMHEGWNHTVMRKNTPPPPPPHAVVNFVRLAGRNRVTVMQGAPKRQAADVAGGPSARTKIVHSSTLPRQGGTLTFSSQSKDNPVVRGEAVFEHKALPTNGRKREQFSGMGVQVLRCEPADVTATQCTQDGLRLTLYARLTPPTSTSMLPEASGEKRQPGSTEDTDGCAPGLVRRSEAAEEAAARSERERFLVERDHVVQPPTDDDMCAIVRALPADVAAECLVLGAVQAALENSPWKAVPAVQGQSAIQWGKILAPDGRLVEDVRIVNVTTGEALRKVCLPEHRRFGAYERDMSKPDDMFKGDETDVPPATNVAWKDANMLVLRRACAHVAELFRKQWGLQEHPEEDGEQHMSCLVHAVVGVARANCLMEKVGLGTEAPMSFYEASEVVLRGNGGIGNEESLELDRAAAMKAGELLHAPSQVCGEMGHFASGISTEKAMEEAERAKEPTFRLSPEEEVAAFNVLHWHRTRQATMEPPSRLLYTHALPGQGREAAGEAVRVFAVDVVLQVPPQSQPAPAARLRALDAAATRITMDAMTAVQVGDIAPASSISRGKLDELAQRSMELGDIELWWGQFTGSTCATTSTVAPAALVMTGDDMRTKLQLLSCRGSMLQKRHVEFGLPVSASSVNTAKDFRVQSACVPPPLNRVEPLVKAHVEGRRVHRPTAAQPSVDVENVLVQLLTRGDAVVPGRSLAAMMEHLVRHGALPAPRPSVWAMQLRELSPYTLGHRSTRHVGSGNNWVAMVLLVHAQLHARGAAVGTLEYMSTLPQECVDALHAAVDAHQSDEVLPDALQTQLWVQMVQALRAVGTDDSVLWTQGEPRALQEVPHDAMKLQEWLAKNGDEPTRAAANTRLLQLRQVQEAAAHGNSMDPRAAAAAVTASGAGGAAAGSESPPDTPTAAEQRCEKLLGQCLPYASALRSVLYAPLYNGLKAQVWDSDGAWKDERLVLLHWHSPYDVQNRCLMAAVFWGSMYPRVEKENLSVRTEGGECGGTAKAFHSWALAARCRHVMEWYARYGRVCRPMHDGGAKSLRTQPDTIKNYSNYVSVSTQFETDECGERMMNVNVPLGTVDQCSGEESHTVSLMRIMQAAGEQWGGLILEGSDAAHYTTKCVVEQCAPSPAAPPASHREWWMTYHQLMKQAPGPVRSSGSARKRGRHSATGSASTPGSAHAQGCWDDVPSHEQNEENDENDGSYSGEEDEHETAMQMLGDIDEDAFLDGAVLHQ